MKLSKFPLLVFLLYCLHVQAVVPDPTPCIKDIETLFFEPAIVQQALTIYQVPQGLWDPIMRTLRQNSLEVPRLLDKRTFFMVPNPIEFPIQPLNVAKILKQILYEVFIDTMRFYDVPEQPTAFLIFNYILSHQARRWIACFGEEVKVILPEIPDLPK